MSYHIARNGQQTGVFSEDEVQSGIATGRFLADDLYWTDGMGEWQALSTRFAFAAPVVVPTYGGGPVNPYAAPQSNIVSLAMKPRHTLASRGSRLGAALLDWLLIGLAVGIPVAFGAVLMNVAEKNGTQPILAISLFIIAGLVLLGLTIYNIVLLATRGQTIAKKWLGMRIVNFADGQNPGFVKAFLLRSFVNILIGQVVPFYPIVDACFIFREDQRCLHDLIADTTVITDTP